MKCAKWRLLALLLPLCFALTAIAQDCPLNIGFEAGSFQGWECFSGKILTDGSLSLMPSAPDPDRHVLIANSFPQAIDPYGNFPVNCPNGSNFSIRLGNAGTGAGAERVSYTFTVPLNQNDYGIIYNYAVVFQNPDHEDYQQPRFTSRVFDVTAGSYLPCGAFEFVASAGLPGFQQSAQGSNIFFKAWSPITVKLFGLAGRTIRLEFTNNDCSRGGHFGYAYLDVNENCSSPITGNTYCGGNNSVTLTAPFGFAGYHWYSSDFTTLLGTSNTLTLTPPPPPNTDYVLVIDPYPGLGCLDTLRTTIALSPAAFQLNVKDSLTSCSGTSVDITLPSITTGSTPGLHLFYFTDPVGEHYAPSPQHIITTGTYYIKGVNTAGCTEIKPIYVGFQPAPSLVITPPVPLCQPAIVDLTLPQVTAGSQTGLVLSYWRDAAATQPLNNPARIDTGAVYYIRATQASGCGIVLPVPVIIAGPPVLKVSNAIGCGFADLRAPAITAGSAPDLQYSYWRDAATTISALPVDNITASGNYFVRATSVYGCTSIAPVQVTVNPFPVFTVTDPNAVTYPATVDLTRAHPPLIGNVLSYWKDAAATKPLPFPRQVDSSGTWYILATSPEGCRTIHPVKVLINAPPPPVISIPNVFSPNNDGINDVLAIRVKGEVELKRFAIYSRWGQLVFETNNITNAWAGVVKSKPGPLGVYYWTFEGLNKYNRLPIGMSGAVTLLR